MAKVIYKYPLEAHLEPQIITTHEDVKWLDIQLQNGNVVLWAEVNNELPTVVRRVKLHFTGNSEVDDDAKYIGTVQTAGGRLVWHAYEVH